jgi:hypothetical protein
MPDEVKRQHIIISLLSWMFLDVHVLILDLLLLLLLLLILLLLQVQHGV